MSSKEEFVGVIKTQVLLKGSKSEHTAIVFQPENSNEFFKLKLTQGRDNPFYEPSLERFIDQRVIIKGKMHGTNLWIDSVDDVTLQNPNFSSKTFKPFKPKGPK